jgi:hypothetical protein
MGTIKAFRNSDGTLDVLKERSLFHVTQGRAKYIGEVGPAWKAWGVQVRRISNNIKKQIFKQDEKF